MRDWIKNKEGFVETYNKCSRSRVVRSTDAFYTNLEVDLNCKLIIMRKKVLI